MNEHFPSEIQQGEHHQKLYPSDEQLFRPIEDLTLSRRSLNCLKRIKVISIRELIQKTEKELLSIPHFGNKSLIEIKTKLLALFPDLQCPLIPRLKIARRTDEIKTNSEDVLKKLNILTKDLILSHRTRKCLEKNDIKYVWQLIQMTEEELLAIKNLGRKSLNELRHIVNDLGLKLRVCFASDMVYFQIPCTHDASVWWIILFRKDFKAFSLSYPSRLNFYRQHFPICLD